MNLDMLKKKELGLPLWAWAIIVSVLVYVLYRHFSGGGSLFGGTSSQDSGLGATDNSAGDLAASPLVDTPMGSSFGAGAPSASGTDPLPIYDMGGDTTDQGFTYPTDQYQENPTVIQPTTNPVAPGDWYDPNNPQFFGLPDTPDKTQSGTTPDGLRPMLNWGGFNFFDKQTFKAWASAHGTTLAKEFAQHPAAARIYATLPSGNSTPTGIGARLSKAGRRVAVRIARPRTSRQTIGRSTGSKSIPSASRDQRSPVRSSVPPPPTRTAVATKTLPAPIQEREHPVPKTTAVTRGGTKRAF